MSFSSEYTREQEARIAVERWRQAFAQLFRVSSPIAQEAYKGLVIEGVALKEPTNGK